MSPKKRKISKKNKKNYLKITIWIFALFAIYVIFFYNENNNPTIGFVAEMVENNYGKEIERDAILLDLPPKYFKALIMLESSGKKEIKPRFEKHIYNRLKKVRSGEKRKYESVSHRMIKNASDEALKNLASSWGPFQIMGYKCVQLGVNVHDLRSNDAIYWGIKWININYGDLLKDGRYKDAFHYHNTGRLYPKFGKSKTYDPDYVTKGLKYMEYFDK